MTTPRRRRQLWLRALGAAVVVVAAAITFAASPANSAPAPAGADHTRSSVVMPPSLVVGGWTTTINGAPYADHLLLFLPGGQMLSFNPTNVQGKPPTADKPFGDGTTDSAGVGTWRIHGNTIEGTFREDNAFQSPPYPPPAAPFLLVTFKVQIQRDHLGLHLVGNALAATSDAPNDQHPATFDGRPIVLDLPTLGQVPPVLLAPW